MDNDISINDTVRSFDFDRHDLEGGAACFVEGIVTAFTQHEGCTRYDIQVTRRVFGGEEKEVEDGERVLPPLNSTPTTMGRICNGVEKILEERKMKETLETFQFATAADLRDWLNAFKTTDLSTVYISPDQGSGYLTLAWEEETLTDGSKVNNIIVS